MSILNQYVNYFPKAIAEKGTAEYYGTKVLLHEILVKMHTIQKHLQIISKLRSLPVEKQREFKNTSVPCFTISCYCEQDGKGSRNANDLIYRTGLICLDLDPKDPSIDLLLLKEKIIKEPYVAYCSLSSRGKGIFIIIYVAEPTKHEEYFKFFENWLNINGCLSVFDKNTKNINRLRFISIDYEYYINNNPIPLSLSKRSLQTKPVHRKSFASKHSVTTPAHSVELAVKILDKQGNYFIDGNQHMYIYNLCRLLNKMGVSQTKAESFVSTLLPLSAVKSNCIDYPYKRYGNEFNTWTENNPIKYNIYNFNSSSKSSETLKISLSNTNPLQKKNTESQSIGYVDSAGKLYIPTPMSDTYTVRDSIEAYNKRIGDYSCIKRTDIDVASFNAVFIDRNTLTIQNL